MTTYRRVETVLRTIRFEFPAPVDAKAVGLAITWLEQEFEKVNGRKTSYDNDWWIEPMDDAVAFCFTVETKTGVEMDHD